VEIRPRQCLLYIGDRFSFDDLNRKRDMDWQPPAGSKISVATDGSDPTVVIPNTGGASRYFTGLFLLFWLGMWTIGFRDAGSKVISGEANAFLVFWLAAWTLGGIFAAFTLYRAFRPSVPETLELKRNGVSYDSGVPPLQFDSSWRYKNTRDAWSAAFPKRVRADLDRRELQSLRLRETESGNRLTVDVDATRIDIAPNASEVEREWLARLLAQRYSLPQALATPAPAAN
jgi:hypothetical protein